jgi:hypothetical protein
MQEPRHLRLCHIGVGYNRDVVRSVPLLSATLPFQLRRIMNLDRPYAPVREGIMDFFPRAAIIPHLDQYGVLFCFPSNALFLRPQFGGVSPQAPGEPSSGRSLWGL